MRKFISLFLISFSANALDLTEPSVAGFISNRLQRIDSMIQGCVNRQEVPGAVAILVKNGRIGYYKSFGLADIAIVVLADTFNADSTNSFNGVALYYVGGWAFGIF